MKRYGSAAAVILVTALAIGPAQKLAAQAPSGEAQRTIESAVADDDIAGVVTSTSGLEAGVWVIAETRDLGTRFAKIVVTDDSGRFVLPDLPKARYQVWVRGYGLVDSPKVAAEPGKVLNLTAVIAPDRAAAAQYYPSDLLVVDAENPGRGEFSRDRSKRQRLSSRIQDAGRVAQFDQDQWLRQLPSDRQLRHSQHSREIPTFRVGDRRLGAACANRSRRYQHGQGFGTAVDARRRTIGRAGRLDRAHRGRRVAANIAHAPRGCRTQPGHHRSRLARSETLPARSRRHRQTRSARQWLRSTIRRDRIKYRRHPDPRSGAQYEDNNRGAGSRSRYAELSLGQSGIRSLALISATSRCGTASSMRIRR